MTDSHGASLRVLLVVVLLTSVSTATATSVLVRDPNPIVPVKGTLSASADLSVDEQRFVYEGVNITAVEVVVNNTGAAHTGTVHAALKDGSGTVVASATTSTTFAGGGTTTVTLSVPEQSVADVSTVESTVQQTD